MDFGREVDDMTKLHHAELAMKAARQVAGSRHKEVVGHSVCYHLLMMIEDSEAIPVQRARRCYQPAVSVKETLSQYDLGF